MLRVSNRLVLEKDSFSDDTTPIKRYIKQQRIRKRINEIMSCRIQRTTLNYTSFLFVPSVLNLAI